MFGAVIHAPGDVRYEERPDPTIVEPTDAVIRTVAACVCGSDLWRYRGIAPVSRPTPIGHEYVGIIEQIGDAVRSVKPGEFGATDIIAERGEEAIAKIKELTDGIGADCVVEAVGTQDARTTAMDATRPGGRIGLLGIPHGGIDMDAAFWANKGVQGGPAPVRAHLPHLLDLVLRREIEPGKVFDLELPLSDVAEAYRAMDERRAIKALLRP